MVQQIPKRKLVCLLPIIPPYYESQQRDCGKRKTGPWCLKDGKPCTMLDMKRSRL